MGHHEFDNVSLYQVTDKPYKVGDTLGLYQKMQIMI